jgi:hypothetical protein
VGAASLVALVLVATSVAGANARKGGVYHGSLSGTQSKISIDVHVSPAGTAVVAITLSALPIYCPGNGPPGTPSIVFAKAKISAAGKFSTTGKDMIASGPLKGSVAATLTVNGTFTATGTLHGTLSTSYGGGAKRCGGHSSYNARV